MKALEEVPEREEKIQELLRGILYCYKKISSFSN